MKPRALLLAAAALMAATAAYAMPHNRPCDIAQDHVGNLNPGGGNAIMFGQCGAIVDGDSSLSGWWGALNCGYQAYRQNKAISTNPYHNDDLKDGWDTGWKDARKACQTGKKPSFDQ
jgi:hypothetical protein